MDSNPTSKQKTKERLKTIAMKQKTTSSNKLSVLYGNIL